VSPSVIMSCEFSNVSIIFRALYSYVYSDGQAALAAPGGLCVGQARSQLLPRRIHLDGRGSFGNEHDDRDAA
jgi:hypothetical protein